MEFFYNCLSSKYKRPFGCLKQHELCSMMLEVPKDCSPVQVELVITTDSGFGLRVSFTLEGETATHRQYRGEFSLPRRGLYFYYFHITVHDCSFDLYRSGETGVATTAGDLWQITCYPRDFETPEYFQGTVMYQIFPDRFYKDGDCDLTGKLDPFHIHEQWGDTPDFLPDEHGETLNNDFFGGNLNGIRKKLDYLSSLGVDVLYLNPISMAFSNHRYDTADYLRIDPMLGTDADFSALCEAAHARGMKVILDGVFSHTGSNSIYFDKNNVFGHGAYSNPESPYRQWFDFQHYPDLYTSWWGILTLPCVDEMNESYLDYVIRSENSVIAHWLALGADGFRLDVADELPDEFIAAFRTKVKELNPDALVLGEVWEDASNKISYDVRRKYFSEGELDAVMNYPFRNAILDFMSDGNSQSFRRQVMTIVEHYPEPVLHCVMNSLSTHDTPRVLTLLGDDFSGTKAEKAERYLSPETLASAVLKEKAATVLQFTLPGSPCIYYGDEAGLEGFEDPLNRRCFPWGKEHTELLEHYRSLSKIRRETKVFKKGSIAFHEISPNTICFTRHLPGHQTVRILVHSGEQPLSLSHTGQLLLLHNGEQSGDHLCLNQWGAAIILEPYAPDSLPTGDASES